MTGDEFWDYPPPKKTGEDEHTSKDSLEEGERILGNWVNSDVINKEKEQLPVLMHQRGR